MGTLNRINGKTKQNKQKTIASYIIFKPQKNQRQRKNLERRESGRETADL